MRWQYWFVGLSVLSIFGLQPLEHEVVWQTLTILAASLSVGIYTATKVRARVGALSRAAFIVKTFK